MTIKELQELYYQSFSVLKNYCDTNGLTVFPVGGTLLGIVRFGDFISWDDDLDLAMPRTDYEELYNKRDQLREQGLVIERYKCSLGFPYPYTKILISNCLITHITDNEYGFDDDLVPAIDLYPIDQVGTTREEAIKKIRIVNVVKKIFDIKVSPLKKISSPIKRAVAALSRLIPLRWILCSFDRCMATKAGESFVTRWRGPDYENHIYDCLLWNESVEMSFRNLIIKVPAGYDTILRDVYGDYTAPYSFQGGLRHTANKNELTRKYLLRVKKEFLE